MNDVFYSLPVTPPSWWELDNSSMVEFSLEQEVPHEFHPLDQILPNKYFIKIRPYWFEKIDGKQTKQYGNWAWRKLKSDPYGYMAKYNIVNDNTVIIKIFTDRPPVHGIWKQVDNPDCTD